MFGGLLKKEAKKLAKLLNTMPKSVQIGPYTFQIIQHQDQLSRIPGGPAEYVGLCDIQSSILHVGGVSNQPSPRFLAGVLFHEILHGIYNTQKIRDKAKEEEIVSNLEVGMLAFFVNNPEFMKWFQNAVK